MIDLSDQFWGNNYVIQDVKEAGTILELAIWTNKNPVVGDYILLNNKENSDGKVRYRITSIKPCRDPRDMYFATVQFAPR